MSEHSSTSGNSIGEGISLPYAESDEALALFRRQVEESGMTDEELERFFEEVRDEIWREKKGIHPHPGQHP